MKKQDLQYNNTLMYAAELLVKVLHEVARKSYKELNIGIGHEEFLVLEAVYLNPGILQIDIAKKVLINRSYVCKLLTRLTEGGYIRTENAIRGKKQVIIKNFATPKGEHIYQTINNNALKTAKQLVNEFEFQQFNQTRDLLLNLSDKMIEKFGLKF